MRGTVAKFLRKKAELLTIGIPGRRLMWRAAGGARKVVGARPVMLVNVNCTRALYLTLKKERGKRCRTSKKSR